MARYWLEKLIHGMFRDVVVVAVQSVRGLHGHLPVPDALLLAGAIRGPRRRKHAGRRPANFIIIIALEKNENAHEAQTSHVCCWAMFIPPSRLYALTSWLGSRRYQLFASQPVTWLAVLSFS